LIAPTVSTVVAVVGGGVEADAIRYQLRTVGVTVLDKIAQFFREVKSELKKVTWPPKKETIASTSVVLVLVFFIALFLFVVDQCLTFLIRMILDA
jgi:preprotein translocase subunit SecE